jgi:cobalamin biosynthesis Mg chelatase CobN
MNKNIRGLSTRLKDEEKAKDMAKKTTRTTQQRAKEEQWRRRMTAQARASTPTLSKSGSTAALEDESEAEPEGYIQADMRQMPNVTTAATTTRIAPAGTTARTTSATSAATAAAQRRAQAASRAARSRLAINTLSVEDEMGYVRSDVRSLVILTVICLAVIIVLAFVIR